MKIFSPPAALKKALEISTGLILCLALPLAVHAAEEPVDLFSGFDDSIAVIETSPESANESTPLFSGFAKLAAAYNTDHEAPQPGMTDWRGLSKLRAELLLEAQGMIGGWQLFGSGKGFYDFAYQLNGRGDYTEQLLDEYESEAELRELYLQGSLLPSLDLKLGRQIVAWGRSDNFRVTDVLNPLDNREPGLTDIEDLRLPLAMTKVDYYLGDWDLGLVAVHEHRYDKNPPYGHDFYPYPFSLPAEDKPAHTLANTELALDLTGTFTGWDLSLYYANIFNDQPDLVFTPPFTFGSEHRRLKVFGAAASIAHGDFLLIGEAAHLQGLGFMVDPDGDYERTDLLVGVEYSGINETVISCDYLHKKLHGYNDLLAFTPESPVEKDEQAALRISRDFRHDTINIAGLAMIFGDRGQRGGLERVTLTWDVADDWSTTLGAVFYESGDTPETAIGDNDRLFLEIRRDF